MKLFTLKKNTVFAVLIAILLMVASCAPKARMASSQLDTPEHHFDTGVKLIEQAKYADADREFDLAIQLDPQYAKAFAGKGLAQAYQRDFNAEFATMKLAWNKAKAKDEKLLVHVNFIRINTLSASACLQMGIRTGVVCSPQSDWLDISKSEFDA